MESIIETFHLDWKVIVAQAINFAIVFVVLYLYALKPLNKLMAERNEKIAKGLNDANTNAKLLKDTELEQEKILAKSRAEADAIFKNAKKEAETKKAQMLEEARNEFSNIVASGKKTLEAEKERMLAEIKKEVVNLTILSTEKLIGQKVDGGFDNKTIDGIKNL